MIYIFVPIAITWIWTVSSLYQHDRAHNIDTLFTAAILTSTTSLFLWSASNAPISLVKDSPGLAVIVLLAMIAAMVVMFWLKFRSAKP